MNNDCHDVVSMNRIAVIANNNSVSQTTWKRMKRQGGKCAKIAQVPLHEQSPP